MPQTGLNLVDLEVTPFSTLAELQAELVRLQGLPPGEDVARALETVRGYIDLAAGDSSPA